MSRMVIGRRDNAWMDGLVITSAETARRLIELGRKDARKVLAEAGMAK